MLRRVEHEKCFITSGPGSTVIHSVRHIVWELTLKVFQDGHHGNVRYQNETMQYSHVALMPHTKFQEETSIR